MQNRAHDRTYREADEGDSPFASVEVVAPLPEDEREGLVKQVDDAINEPVVDCGEVGNAGYSSTQTSR